ncbi:MAG: hypothetical protein HC811_06540 [Flammeovirgaceae bacterium]|nr:hypothetical protein [Flammeovirgaceae bacterium]
MNKNIIIGILTAITISSLVYGYAQHQRAENLQAQATRFEQLAIEQADLARLAAQDAMEQKRMAEEHAAIAEKEE